MADSDSGADAEGVMDTSDSLSSRSWPLTSDDEILQLTDTQRVNPWTRHHTKLAEEVLRRLRMAREIDDQQDRDTIVRHLILDLAGEMGTRASTSLGSEKQGRFYETLAETLHNDESIATDLLNEFENLWLHPKVPLIFAAVFYRYLLNLGDLDNPEKTKQVHICMNGIRYLFWSDIYSSSKRFSALYIFLRDEIVLTDKALVKMSPKMQIECTKLVARFSLYYASPKDVAQIVASFPTNQEYGANVLDFFIREIISVMKRTKVEAVLIAYMRSLVELNELISLSLLTLVTSTRLQELLFTLSQPGGPYYPPREVRGEASHTFALIYPNGKYLRAIFKIGTSILHPSYGLQAFGQNIWKFTSSKVSSWMPWNSRQQ